MALDISAKLAYGPEQMEDRALHKAITISLKRGGTGRSFTAQVQALDLTGDLGAAARILQDGPANTRAMSLASKMCASKAMSPCQAVYLIAPDDGLEVVKVGTAADPACRLVTLQIGNWNKLAVHGLLWLDRGAGGVERLVHEAAKEMGIAVRGEWLSCSLAEASELVLKAARFAKIPCYDSDIWIKNWASRVDALAESKGITRRIAA